MLERNLFFGIDDIKGICLECASCSTRVRLPPDKLNVVPAECPGCHTEWTPLLNEERPAPVAPYRRFALALRQLRETILREHGALPYRVLLEFDEP